MRNLFLFIRRYFNFLFFLVLQMLALTFLFRYNRFHEAAFSNVAGELTGKINERYSNVEYYFKLPNEMSDRDVIVVDPMLATGNSAVAAVERVKTASPRSIKFVCLLAAPEGLTNLQESHPDVPIFTAAVDDGLTSNAYITPGLGDAGDRYFGTI